jgi:hypothetical protein
MHEHAYVLHVHVKFHEKRTSLAPWTQKAKSNPKIIITTKLTF